MCSNKYSIFLIIVGVWARSWLFSLKKKKEKIDFEFRICIVNYSGQRYRTIYTLSHKALYKDNERELWDSKSCKIRGVHSLNFLDQIKSFRAYSSNSNSLSQTSLRKLQITTLKHDRFEIPTQVSCLSVLVSHISSHFVYVNDVVNDVIFALQSKHMNCHVIIYLILVKRTSPIINIHTHIHTYIVGTIKGRVSGRRKFPQIRNLSDNIFLWGCKVRIFSRRIIISISTK